MTAMALSLDPAGRQPSGISGRHAAPPALAPERAREILFNRRDQNAGFAMTASLLLHLIVAGAALAAFGGETMGGSGGSAGDGEGSGILVELVAMAPADVATAAQASAPKDAIQAEETKEAEAPKIEAAAREIVLPSPPTDAEAIPLNVPPPEPEKTAKSEEKPKPVEKPKPTEARREAPKPAPAKAKDPSAPQQAKPADAASAPSQSAMADTSAARNSDALNAGAAGTANTGGAGGDQVAALGGTGLRVLQARFRVTPPPPPYPRGALSMHQEGVVLLRALIDEQGVARQIRLQASSGYPLLDKAALQAVEEWQFMPETVNGRAVAVWVEVPVRFKIN